MDWQTSIAPEQGMMWNQMSSVAASVARGRQKSERVGTKERQLGFECSHVGDVPWIRGGPVILVFDGVLFFWCVRVAGTTLAGRNQLADQSTQTSWTVGFRPLSKV